MEGSGSSQKITDPEGSKNLVRIRNTASHFQHFDHSMLKIPYPTQRRISVTVRIEKKTLGQLPGIDFNDNRLRRMKISVDFFLFALNRRSGCETERLYLQHETNQSYCRYDRSDRHT
jgi:hypothetical protein